MINLRHLSTETLKELSRGYEIEKVVLSALFTSEPFSLTSDAYVALGLLDGKIQLVDKEIRRRIALSLTAAPRA